MENEFYRDNLSRILERFPGRELLNVKDVCLFTGMSYRTVKRRFPFQNCRITAATLARCLCRGTIHEH